MGLASSVFARCDDSSGTVNGIFHEAVNDVGRLAETAGCDTVELTEHTYQALLDNNYGQFDHLIAALRGWLGNAGLSHFDAALHRLVETPLEKPKDDKRRKVRLVLEWSTASFIWL